MEKEAQGEEENHESEAEESDLSNTNNTTNTPINTPNKDFVSNTLANTPNKDFVPNMNSTSVYNSLNDSSDFGSPLGVSGSNPEKSLATQSLPNSLLSPPAADRSGASLPERPASDSKAASSKSSDKKRRQKEKKKREKEEREKEERSGERRSQRDVPKVLKYGKGLGGAKKFGRWVHF